MTTDPKLQHLATKIEQSLEHAINGEKVTITLPRGDMLEIIKVGKGRYKQRTSEYFGGEK